MQPFDNLTQLPLHQRWRGQVQPVPGVLNFIRRGPRYLMIQRQQNPYKGSWSLVGGHWEFGETLMTAAVREVKEETGLDTTFVALRGLVSERIAPSGGNRRGAHYLLFVCEVNADHGEPAEQQEGPLAWFTLEELGELFGAGRVAPTDFEMIRRFSTNPVFVPVAEAAVVAGDDADTLVDFTSLM